MNAHQRRVHNRSLSRQSEARFVRGVQNLKFALKSEGINPLLAVYGMALAGRMVRMAFAAEGTDTARAGISEAARSAGAVPQATPHGNYGGTTGVTFQPLPKEPRSDF
ncbi:MAG: hypothetical protein E6Q78_03060 [Rhodoferax sp.]|nr:MAG: hypothetical protein E6Q78_03060 [Rhodoferax sp.]